MVRNPAEAGSGKKWNWVCKLCISNKVDVEWTEWVNDWTCISHSESSKILGTVLPPSLGGIYICMYVYICIVYVYIYIYKYIYKNIYERGTAEVRLSYIQ